MVFATMISTKAYAYDLEVDGLYYNLDMDNYTATVTSGDNKYAGDIVVPSQINYKTAKFDVVKIGSSAFSSCDGLTSVTISDGIKEIENSAFASCDKLVKVTIPSSVQTFGNDIFKNCIELVEAILPEGIEKIEYGTFQGCSSLPEIQIPSTVKTIEGYAYRNCKSVKKLSIPNHVVAINGYSTLENLTLDEFIVEDGDDELKVEWYPFSDTSAKVVYIGRPVNLTSYFKSDEIETLILGPKLNKWYDSYTGTGVKKVISKIADPSQLAPTFDNITYLDAELIVPKGTLDLYKADPNWKKFLSISEETTTGINNANADVNAQGAQRFTLGGMRTSGSSKGISIIRENGKVKKVVR